MLTKMQSPEKFLRVFIHELGHLVAKEITFKHFKIREAASISITYDPNEDDYFGETSPYVPSDADREQPTVNHAEKLIDLEYGCMFQAIFQRTRLNDCLSRAGNGWRDLQEWEAIIAEKSASGMKLVDLQSAHLTKLLELKLNELLDPISFKDLIQKQVGNVYLIDMGKVREMILPIIELLEADFLSYLSNVKSILDRQAFKSTIADDKKR